VLNTATESEPQALHSWARTQTLRVKSEFTTDQALETEESCARTQTRKPCMLKLKSLLAMWLAAVMWAPVFASGVPLK
jgi:hypothetical protein